MSAIHIPPVRTLPDDDLAARAAACTTWHAAFAAQGEAGLGRPPPEVRTVLQSLDEGSSSEDTSDEAYRARHKPMEEDEHLRLSGYPGGEQLRHQRAAGMCQCVIATVAGVWLSGCCSNITLRD